jgi:hypothetical protein
MSGVLLGSGGAGKAGGNNSVIWLPSPVSNLGFLGNAKWSGQR